MSLDPNSVRAAVEAIESAFAGLSPPTDDDMVHPQCMDDGDIVDFYRPVPREQLSDATIIRKSGALSAFSAEAFRYYLPAYMIWALTHSDSSAFTLESTLYQLDPAGRSADLRAFQVSKYALFTAAQREAVIRFLEAFLTDPELGPDARAALDGYWCREDTRRS